MPTHPTTAPIPLVLEITTGGENSVVVHDGGATTSAAFYPEPAAPVLGPYEKAKLAFDATGDGRLQSRLAAWQTLNFGPQELYDMLAGVTEETGELARALLKHKQKIRGFANRTVMEQAAADALADIAIYSMNLATLLRIDYLTLLAETAEKVMERDWRKDPVHGSGAAEGI